MIRASLTINEIAKCLGGDVVSSNMVRAPMPDADWRDRSLLLSKTSAGLIVIPTTGEGDFKRRNAVKADAEAYVKSKLDSVLT